MLHNAQAVKIVITSILFFFLVSKKFIKMEVSFPMGVVVVTIISLTYAVVRFLFPA